MKKFALPLLIASTSLLVGGLVIWFVHRDAEKGFDDLQERALCVLELPAEVPSVRKPFTIAQRVDHLLVGVRPGQNREAFQFAVSGRQGLMCTATTEDMRFGWSREFPPGSYEITVCQKGGNHGALVAVAAEESVHLTGWQILSRTYVGILALSAIGALVARKSSKPRVRAGSLYLFHMLMLGFLAAFVYLLFHEGGHSLAEICFGRYDFARSDFWGIHGTPHSGGKPGPSLAPWQLAFISGAGPFLPALAGWALFLLWRSRFGRNVRIAWPIVNLYSSAVVGILLFPLFALAGCLLGLLSDGDWQGFITNVSGTPWLVQTLVWGTLLVNVVVLWHVVPELWRAWKVQYLKLGVENSSPTRKT